MPIKLATPAPLTFELRRDPGQDPFFYALERPELSIICTRSGRLHVAHYGDLCDPPLSSIESAEAWANAIHARLCTFEQPQPEDATAEPAKPRTVQALVYGKLVNAVLDDPSTSE